jgi:hypothetical protein
MAHLPNDFNKSGDRIGTLDVVMRFVEHNQLVVEAPLGN